MGSPSTGERSSSFRHCHPSLRGKIVVFLSSLLLILQPYNVHGYSCPAYDGGSSFGEFDCPVKCDPTNTNSYSLTEPNICPVYWNYTQATCTPYSQYDCSGAATVTVAFKFDRVITDISQSSRLQAIIQAMASYTQQPVSRFFVSSTSALPSSQSLVNVTITASTGNTSFAIAAKFQIGYFTPTSSLRTSSAFTDRIQETPVYYGTAPLCVDTNRYQYPCPYLCSTDGTTVVSDINFCPIKCSNSTLYGNNLWRTPPQICPVIYDMKESLCDENSTPSCATTSQVEMRINFKISSTALTSITSSILQAISTQTGVALSRLSVVSVTSLTASTSKLALHIDPGVPTSFDATDTFQTAFFTNSSSLRTSTAFANVDYFTQPVYVGKPSFWCRSGVLAVSEDLCPVLCPNGVYLTPPSECAIVYQSASTCLPSTTPACGAAANLTLTLQFNSSCANLNQTGVMLAVANTTTSFSASRISVVSLVDIPTNICQISLLISPSSSPTVLTIATNLNSAFQHFYGTFRLALPTLDYFTWPTYTAVAQLCGDMKYELPCPILCTSDYSTWAIDDDHCPVTCADGSIRTLPSAVCPLTYDSSSICSPSATPTCAAAVTVNFTVYFKTGIANVVSTSVVSAIAAQTSVAASRFNIISLIDIAWNETSLTLQITPDATVSGFTVMQSLWDALYNAASSLRQSAALSGVDILTRPSPIYGTANACVDGITFTLVEDACPVHCHDGSWATYPSICPPYYTAASTCLTTTTPSCVQFASATMNFELSASAASLNHTAVVEAIAAATSAPEDRFTNVVIQDEGNGRSSVAISVSEDVSLTVFDIITPFQTAFYTPTSSLRLSPSFAAAYTRNLPSYVTVATLCTSPLGQMIYAPTPCIASEYPTDHCPQYCTYGQGYVAVDSYSISLNVWVQTVTCTNCTAGYMSGGYTSTCIPCATGSFAASHSASTCTLCTKGSFTNITASTQCIPCDAGKYSSQAGAASCDSCAPGTITATTGLTTCSRCNPGSASSDFSSSVCSACAIGKYSAISGDVQCETCAVGAYTATTGLSICSVCPAGSYNTQLTTVGGPFCSLCPAGTYSASGSTLSGCLSCAAGYYSLSGDSVCTQCQTGKYSSTANSTICSSCLAGTFSSINGAVNCESCSAGSITATAGLSICLSCAAGSASSGSGSSVCSACAIGTYSSTAAATTCSTCALGSYTATTGLSICSVCSAGSYATQSTTAGGPFCSFCATGKYSAPGSILSGCLNCAAGYYSLSGDSVCTQCQPGNYSASAGASICSTCLAGKFSSLNGAVTCESCSAGSITASAGLSVCTACTAGFASSGSGSSVCTSCAIGTYSSTAAATTCNACAVGSYTATTGLSTCSSCSAGYYSTQITTAGGPFCSTCAAGKSSIPGSILSGCLSCAAGSVSQAGDTMCSQCLAGNYAPISGLSVCSACPAGKFSSSSGAVGCDACPVGQITATTGLSQCSNCQVGYFASNCSSSVCTACAAGTFSNVTGTQFCSSCAAGSVTGSTGLSVCSACTSGRYAANAGASTCVRCSPGTIAPAGGAGSCTECPQGYATSSNTDATASACVACSLGYYAASVGQSACVACPAGYSAPIFASTNCTMCQAGTYSNSTASGGCTLCDIDSAQPYAGQTGCNDCVTGSSASTRGSLVCSPCTTGTIQVTSGCTTDNHGKTKCTSSTCTPCIAGTYADTSVSPNVCRNCTAGTYSTVASVASECYQCDVGTYSVMGSSVCTSCSIGTASSIMGTQNSCPSCTAGKFSHLAHLVSCLDCPAGTFSNIVTGYSKFQCTLCSAGFYQNSTGQSTCVACQSGRFSSYAGAGWCEACGPGTYASSTGLSTCSSCAAGTASNTTSSSGCTSCNIGQYSDDIGATTCKTCASGSYTATTGLSQCSTCGAGTYSTQITTVGGPFCSSCAAGQWSASGSLLSGCYDCPPGSSSNAGDSSCTLCDVGTFSSSSASPACTSCQAGRFSSYVGAVLCESCSAGMITGTTGLSVCSSCSAGSSSSGAGSSNCDQCGIGKYSDSDAATSCTSCASGSYTSTTGMSICTQCGAGTYSTQTTSASGPFCSPCDAGRWSAAGSLQQQCYACPAGTWSAAGSSSCTPCSAGTSAINSASAQCDPCSDGYYADKTGYQVCLPCARGSYTNTTVGYLNCTLCDVGTYAEEVAATSCSACNAGSYSNSVGSSSCAQCDAGKFNSGSGLTGCTNCTQGFISSAGSNQCSGCAVGRYVSDVGQSVCQMCNPGSFTNVTGSNQCVLCAAGTAQSVPGKSICSSCTDGTYTNSAGNHFCTNCDPGHYSNSATGFVTCHECPEGQYQQNAASNQCTACEAGRYSNVTGSIVCENCPGGRYTSSTGLSFCSSCGIGRYSMRGASGCTRCSPGTFAAVNGTSACSTCAAGSFTAAISDLDASNCTVCAVGFYADQFTGSPSCVACPVGRFASVTGLSTCTHCASGSYSATTGVSVCTTCELGRSQPDVAATKCVPCRNGTFAGVRGLAICTSCAEGSYTATTESTVCTLCAPGQHQSSFGQSGCVACIAGKYAAINGSLECDACNPGRFSVGSGNIGCVDCSAGSYLSVAGGTGCDLCAPGEISAASALVCSECPRATFASGYGNTVCSNCTDGFYNENNGASACLDCSLGFSSAYATSICKKCPAGRYEAADKQCVDCDIGTFAADPGQSECDPCDPGTYQPTKAQSLCLQCAKGTYANSTGFTLCLACEPGTFASDPSSSSCAQCRTGQYSPAPSATICLECDLGTYSASNGSIGCNDCDAGKYTNRMGSSVCARCDLGTTASGKASSCSACKAGFFSSSPDMDCTKCPKGTAASQPGAITCTPCQPGTYALSEGLSSCYDCSAGTFNPYVNASSCSPCAAGQISATDRAVNCTTCEAGYISGLPGLTACSECGFGYYSPTPSGHAATSCSPCSAGSFQPNVTATTCELCSPGFYSSAAGQSKCLPCKQGTAASEYGSTSCEPCLPGFIAVSDESPVCTPCPIGRYQAVGGQYFCDPCDIGKFTNFLNSTICQTCPVGALCNTSGTALIAVGPSPGYWARTNNEGGIDASELQFYECPFTDACLGGNTSSCADGYTGPVCAICQDGYFIRSGTCYPCQSVNIGVGLAVALGALFALLLGLRMAYNHKGVRSVTPGGLIKLVVGFIQVMQVVQANYSIPFPSFLAQAMYVGRLLLLQVVQILSFDCVKRVSFYNSLVVAAVLPVVVCMALFAAYFAIPWMTMKKRNPKNNFGLIVKPLPDDLDPDKRKKKREEERKKKIASGETVDEEEEKRVEEEENDTPVDLPIDCLPIDQLTPAQLQYLLNISLSDEKKLISHRRNFLIKLIFIFITIVYPAVSIMVFQTFVCRDINGTAYLMADYTLQCWTREHYTWLIVSGVIVLLVPIGVPLFLALFLYYRVAKRKAFLNSECLHRYGHLYTDYHTAYYWWECAELIRKLLLSAVIAFLAQGTSLQIVAGLFVALVFHLLHAICNPFIDKSYGYLQHGFLAIIWIALLAGLVLKLASLDESTASDTGGVSGNYTAGMLIVILYGAILAIAVAIIVMKVRHYLKSRKTKNENFAKQLAIDKKHANLDKGAVSPLDGKDASSPLDVVPTARSGLESVRLKNAMIKDGELESWLVANGGVPTNLKVSMRTRDGGSDLSAQPNEGKLGKRASSDELVTGDNAHTVNIDSSPRLGAALPGAVISDSDSSDSSDSSTDTSSSDDGHKKGTKRTKSQIVVEEKFRRSARDDKHTASPLKVARMLGELSPMSPNRRSTRRNKTFAITEEDSAMTGMKEQSITRLMAEYHGHNQKGHSGSDEDNSHAKPDRGMSISRQMFQLMGGQDMDHRMSRLSNGDEHPTSMHRPSLHDEELLQRDKEERKHERKLRKAAKKEKRRLEAQAAAVTENAKAAAAAEAAMDAAAQEASAKEAAALVAMLQAPKGTPNFYSPAEFAAKESLQALAMPSAGLWSSNFGAAAAPLPAMTLPSTRPTATTTMSGIGSMHARGPSNVTSAARVLGRSTRPGHGVGAHGMRPPSLGNISLYNGATPTPTIPTPPLAANVTSPYQFPAASPSVAPVAAGILPVAATTSPNIIAAPRPTHPTNNYSFSTSLSSGPTTVAQLGGKTGVLRKTIAAVGPPSMNPDAARFVFMPAAAPKTTPSPAPTVPIPMASTVFAVNVSSPTSLASSAGTNLPSNGSIGGMSAATLSSLNSPTPVGEVGSHLEDPALETISLASASASPNPATPLDRGTPMPPITPRRSVTAETSVSNTLSPQARPAPSIANATLTNGAVLPLPNSPLPSSTSSLQSKLVPVAAIEVPNSAAAGAASSLHEDASDEDEDDEVVEEDDDLDDFLPATQKNVLHRKK